jgi:hypothetical protein
VAQPDSNLKYQLLYSLDNGMTWHFAAKSGNLQGDLPSVSSVQTGFYTGANDVTAPFNWDISDAALPYIGVKPVTVMGGIRGRLFRI